MFTWTLKNAVLKETKSLWLRINVRERNANFDLKQCYTGAILYVHRNPGSSCCEKTKMLSCVLTSRFLFFVQVPLTEAEIALLKYDGGPKGIIIHGSIPASHIPRTFVQTSQAEVFLFPSLFL